MANTLSELATMMSDILSDNLDGDVSRYDDLDADDIAEFAVELDDGRRCLVQVVAHHDD